MSLAYTGRLGEAIVEIHRPNDIRDEPARFDFILKMRDSKTGVQQSIHTEPSRADLEELHAALSIMLLHMRTEVEPIPPFEDRKRIHNA